MAKKKARHKREQSVLRDHKRIGTRFIPPMAQLALKPSSWYRDKLPELLWIALLCDQQGYKLTVDSALALSELLNSVVSEDTKRISGFFCASDFIIFSETEQEQIIARIDEKLQGILDPCLGTILKFYPEFPMGWLVSKSWIDKTSIGIEGLNDIKNAIRTRMDRFSKQTMECQVLAWVLEVKSGKVKFPKGMEILDPNLISEYPNSEESKTMGARVRASLSAFMGMRREQSDWVPYFWKHSYEISTCEYPEIIPDYEAVEGDKTAEVLSLGEQFRQKSEEEMKELWNKVEVNCYEPLRSNVILGLIARNLQFAVDVVKGPNIWKMPIGGIIIRCMVETIIRLHWLIKCGTPEDYEEYINFGLGQEKLLVEHYKRIAEETRPDKDIILGDIERRETWINSQLYTFLVSVDVGGGTQGKDLRTLAEEAGVLDLHRLVYSPLSSYVHGHWNSVARLNLHHCMNPLHGGHYLPAFPIRANAISCAIDAVNYFNESFELASQALIGTSTECEAAVNYLTGLQKLFESNDK